MKTGYFVGLTGMDIVYYQSNMPLEDTKSKTNDYQVAVGGPVANAAITYSLLGGKSILITSIGNSNMGRTVKQQLENDYNIRVIDVNCSKDMLPNISNIVINTSNGSRTIISGQQGINTFNNILDYGFLEEADFILCDCNLYNLSIEVFRRAKEKPIPIVLDAGSWKENMETYLNLATDVIASSACKPFDKSKNFADVAKDCGVKNIAITCGELPIKWQDNNDEGTITPMVVTAVDTLGAGDVFHGAYCYFKFKKEQPFEEALYNASAVASYSVMHRGIDKGIKDYINDRK